MTCKKPDVSYLFHSQRRWKFHQNWNIEGCRPWTAFRREATLLLSGRFLRCFKNFQNVSKIFKGCVSGCFRTRKAPVVGYQGPGIPGIGIGGAGRSPNGAALPIRCSQTSAWQSAETVRCREMMRDVERNCMEQWHTVTVTFSSCTVEFSPLGKPVPDSVANVEQRVIAWLMRILFLMSRKHKVYQK